MLEAVQLSASAKTHFHFVDDDLNAMSAATLLNRREKARRRDDKSAIGHQRLDEYGGHLSRHVRRMREIYSCRHAALLEAARKS